MTSKMSECLRLMALHILRQVSAGVQANQYYSIMADECTNIANKEQFTIYGSMTIWMIMRTSLVCIRLTALMLTVLYELLKTP